MPDIAERAWEFVWYDFDSVDHLGDCVRSFDGTRPQPCEPDGVTWLQPTADSVTEAGDELGRAPSCRIRVRAWEGGPGESGQRRSGSLSGTTGPSKGDW